MEEIKDKELWFPSNDDYPNIDVETAKRLFKEAFPIAVVDSDKKPIITSTPTQKDGNFFMELWKKAFPLIIIIMLNVSCNTGKPKEEINCKYQGGIILQRYDIDGVYYTIKYKGKLFEFVPVYSIDTNYNVGDTINKPCIK